MFTRRHYLVVLLLLAALIGFPPTSAAQCSGPTLTTVQAADATDTTVSGPLPMGPWTFAGAALPLLHVGWQTVDYRALMPFNTVALPACCHVINAQLALTVTAIVGINREVLPGQIDLGGGFVAPNHGPPALLATGLNNLDVTPVVQQWCSLAHPNNGIGLRQNVFPNPWFIVHIDSANSANPPTLTVNWQQ